MESRANEERVRKKQARGRIKLRWRRRGEVPAGLLQLQDVLDKGEGLDAGGCGQVGTVRAAGHEDGVDVGL